MDWRRYAAEEIEAQFNPRRSVPDFEDHQARHAAWSAAARTALDGHLDVPYGAGPLHKIDIFPAPGARHAPLHVFFHGGYVRPGVNPFFARRGPGVVRYFRYDHAVKKPSLFVGADDRQELLGGP